jgi:CDP-diacylglycerol--serine O-phosphatidyltransferase
VTIYNIQSEFLAYIATGFAIATGLLMVSNFRYYSFKDINLRGRVSFMWAILIVLLFALAFTNPPVVLFSIFTLYAISGLVLTLGRKRRMRSDRKVA